MNKRVVFIISLMCCFQNIFSQGLKFNGNECLINERTSYNVFNNKTPTFKNYFSISFDILFSHPSKFGYILRIKNVEQNVIFNLSYNGTGERAIFKFSEEGRSNLIAADFSFDEIENYRWHKIDIFFDLKNDSLFLTINDKQFKFDNLLLPDTWKPTIQFGKSDYMIDVPSFAIKDLIVKGSNKDFVFPLNQYKGEFVYDKKGNITGIVKEPVWLINNAYYWKVKKTFRSQTVAGSNFNSRTQEIYYFNEDSIIFLNVMSNEIRSERYREKSPMSFRLGTNFIDTLQNKLYVYEVYTPLKGDVTISELELEDNNWKIISNHFLPRQLHHHAGLFDTNKNRYILYGGFGNQRFNDDFYSFDLNTNKWDTLTFIGDQITPRYFSSIGNFKGTNKIYLFGGMGNESGDQDVGRNYYYDLYEIDLDLSSIQKLWEISWKNDKIVPVRSLFVNDSCFYTLCYPEHFSNSYLKLYRFYLHNGKFEILGDSIPIRSEKINTNANLYFNEIFNEIYVTVQEFEDDDIASTLTVYSLSFPSITLNELFLNTTNSPFKYYWIFFALLFLLGITVLSIILKMKYKDVETQNLVYKNNEKNPDSIIIHRKQDRANAIYLFGDFSVRDKNKKEISYMFSAKLKQTFFLILQYSLENGITSQHLSEILWSDKREDKIKNLRGVTINHLRKILNELNGIYLVHEKGYYRFIITDECYCDYKRCFEIILSESLEIQESINEFISIVARGKFLKSDNSPTLDSFKQKVEYELEPVLLLEIEKTYAAEKYKTTIILSEAIFNFDPVNENVIKYLVRSFIKLNMFDEAKRRFVHFTLNHKQITGEDFAKSFAEIVT